MSPTASPPSFSRAARASSHATAASATTASASTAATSLRSTSAWAGSPVARSTESSGRISVGSGFIAARTTTGSPVVVRAGMKPLPTLMRPLDSVDLATGEPAQALVERSDVAAVESLAVVAEAAVAWELARAAHEKFGGDSIGDFVAAWRAYLERISWAEPPK